MLSTSARSTWLAAEWRWWFLQGSQLQVVSMTIVWDVDRSPTSEGLAPWPAALYGRVLCRMPWRIWTWSLQCWSSFSWLVEAGIQEGWHKHVMTGLQRGRSRKRTTCYSSSRRSFLVRGWNLTKWELRGVISIQKMFARSRFFDRPRD